MPPKIIAVPSGSATAILQHVVYIQGNSGDARIYAGGTLVKRWTIDGSLSNCKAVYKWILASEATGDRS